MEKAAGFFELQPFPNPSTFPKNIVIIESHASSAAFCVTIPGTKRMPVANIVLIT